MIKLEHMSRFAAFDNLKSYKVSPLKNFNNRRHNLSDGCLYPVELRSYNSYESIGLPTSLRIFQNNYFQCQMRIVGCQFYAEAVGHFYAGIYRHDAAGRYIVMRTYR